MKRNEITNEYSVVFVLEDIKPRQVTDAAGYIIAGNNVYSKIPEGNADLGRNDEDLARKTAELVDKLAAQHLLRNCGKGADETIEIIVRRRHR